MGKDPNKKQLVLFIVLFSVAMLALVAIAVVYIVFCTRKAGRIARTLGVRGTEDSIKLGSTLVRDDSLDQAIELKKSIPFPVILSLTSSPQRLRHLHKILQLIHPAMYDSIHLNIPARYKRTDEPYQVPPSLSHFPKLHIFSQPIDDGPVMKLLPTVKRLREKAIVVTLDDDTAYSTSDLAKILDALAHYKYEAVVARGTQTIDSSDPMLKQRAPIELRQGDRFGDIVEGYALVGYPSWLVDSDALHKFSQLSKPCFQSDDLTISFALALHSVLRINVHASKEPPYLTALSYGLGGDALHVMQSHAKAYKTCSQQIRDFLREKQASQ